MTSETINATALSHHVSTTSTHPTDEYRFQGALGFGGKFRNNGNKPHPYVDCYREDETPERRAMIERTNAALAALFSTDTCSPIGGPAPMDDFYGDALRKLCAELRTQRTNMQKDKHGQFAQAHRSYIAVLDDLIERAEARLPAPAKTCLACGKRFSPIVQSVVYCGCNGRRLADDS